MRTEEEKIVQAPIVISLGGLNYDIKLLPIRDSRGWRKRVAELLGDIPKYAKVSADAPDEFAVAMNSMISSMPDAIIDLVFDYAKELNREEIEAVATDEEIGAAFSKIMEVAFPLSRSLGVRGQ